MDDFLSRLADKSLGLTAVIQPRPVSLFEPAPTSADSPVAPLIPTIETETNAPSPPVNEELAVTTEAVRSPQMALPPETPLPTPQETIPLPKTMAAELAEPQLLPETPPPTPQETIRPPKIVATELVAPQVAEIQRPLPAMQEGDSSSLPAVSEPTHQSPSKKNIPPPTQTDSDSLPLPVISPRVVEKVATLNPELPPEEAAQIEPSVSIETTAVSTPVIQRIVATPPPLLIENTTAMPDSPPALPIIKPMPVEPTITSPISVEQSQPHPRESSNPSPLTPPTIRPTSPLVKSHDPTIAVQPVPARQQYDEPELPEPIRPETTIISPPPAATAVIQPAITLYQEPERQTAVSPAPTPTVAVRIGRIEVRAAPPPSPAAPPTKKQPAAPLVMSLDDYLRQRENGGVS